MAIASCSVKIISRGKGRSAVAAAAYRAGQELQNEADGVSHNYTRKSGIVHTDILTPSSAPDWAHDRQQLWNRVELTERRCDARLAREVMIALPRELSTDQNVELARAYAKTFVEQGMIADVSVHDGRDGNPHAHIMLTTRPLDGNEFSKKKNRDWDSTDNLIEWRKAYEDITNRYLQRYGHEERIDVRSYEGQGIDLLPTVHLGPHAHRMEQMGIPTERGDINRKIQEANREIAQINAEISVLQKECKKEQETEKENEPEAVYLQPEWQEPEKTFAHEYPAQPPIQRSEVLNPSEQRKLAARKQEQERLPVADQKSQPPPSVHRPHEGRTLAQQRSVAQERHRQAAADPVSAGQVHRPERSKLSEQRRLAAQEQERLRSQEQPGSREAPAHPGRPPPLKRHREERKLAQQRKAAQERDSKRVYENPSRHAMPHKPGHERDSDFVQNHEGQQHHTMQGEQEHKHDRKAAEDLLRRKKHDREI